MNKRNPYGVVMTRNVVKPCKYCGIDVHVKAKNVHAVCADWECQCKFINAKNAQEAKWGKEHYRRKLSKDAISKRTQHSKAKPV